ncbi:MAG: hypothetical protein RLZZ511_4070 [Cyanobacteriota bacterium]
MELDINPIKIAFPFGFYRRDGSLRDTIEAQCPVVNEFGDVLTAFCFLAPALKILAFFDQADLGVMDAEAKGPIGSIIIG